jgi:hypothetical protein
VADRKSRSTRERKSLKRPPTSTAVPVEGPAQIAKQADGRPVLQGDDGAVHAEHPNLQVFPKDRSRAPSSVVARRAWRVAPLAPQMYLIKHHGTMTSPILKALIPRALDTKS